MDMLEAKPRLRNDEPLLVIDTTKPKKKEKGFFSRLFGMVFFWT